MLPLHPVAPIGTTPDAPRGRIRALVLTSVALAVLATVAGGSTAGFVVLALAVTALGAAAVLGLRAGWTAALPAPAGSAARTRAASPVDLGAATGDELTERLRQLHDDHVEKVNMAVGEGREDLVQELSESYTDQALGLITGGARPSRDRFPLR
jgi:hypothetical protein